MGAPLGRTLVPGTTLCQALRDCVLRVVGGLATRPGVFEAVGSALWRSLREIVQKRSDVRLSGERSREH